MREHRTELRVRYSETDQMGHVYHGSYLPYFEIGRVEWLRDKGISYKSMEEGGIGLPIVSLTLNYKKSARYDDVLTIVTRYKSQTSVKLEFDCEIWNDKQELLTKAYFLLVFIDLQSGRPKQPPQYIRDLLKKVEEN